MHTPEQARNLWCPMVRASNGEDQPANTGNSEPYRTPPFARCIGGKCAMWRWGSTDSAPPPNATPGALYVAEKVRSTTHGYCGLAGTPRSAAA